MKEMDEVNITIVGLCEWIQNELSTTSAVMEQSILPDMIKALAELVSAKAS